MTATGFVAATVVIAACHGPAHAPLGAHAEPHANEQAEQHASQHASQDTAPPTRPTDTLATAERAHDAAEQAHDAANAATRAIPIPALADRSPRDAPGLHNVVAYHDGVLSGSVPEGPAGFDQLAAWGVRTIISVDGAAPDAAAARARGIRTIHLPIGYDGFDDVRRLELARATRDARARGPVYLHCHHGKHRSAGALAAAAVTLGWSDPDAMIDRMHVSGTSPNYTGLYAVASDATVAAPAALDAVPDDFPEAMQPDGLVASMVAIGHATTHLEQIRDAGWTAPATHPDLVPVAEAGRLADVLRLLRDDPDTAWEPDEYRAILDANWEAAQTLESMLDAGAEAARLTAQLAAVKARCTECHQAFRD